MFFLAEARRRQTNRPLYAPLRNKVYRSSLSFLEKRRTMRKAKGDFFSVSCFFPFGVNTLRLFGKKVKEESVKFISDALLLGVGGSQRAKPSIT